MWSTTNNQIGSLPSPFSLDSIRFHGEMNTHRERENVTTFNSQKSLYWCNQNKQSTNHHHIRPTRHQWKLVFHSQSSTDKQVGWVKSQVNSCCVSPSMWVSMCVCGRLGEILSHHHHRHHPHNPSWLRIRQNGLQKTWKLFLRFATHKFRGIIKKAQTARTKTILCIVDDDDVVAMEAVAVRYCCCCCWKNRQVSKCFHCWPGALSYGSFISANVYHLRFESLDWISQQMCAVIIQKLSFSFPLCV